MFALLGYGLAPLAAAGVAAAGTAALVALYLLREREQRVAVAFVALWDPGGGEKRLERIGRRLRRWLSLLLQLAILWLLVLSLVDPRPAESARAAHSWLIMIDRSASTSGRMAAARARAHQVLATLPPGDRAMVATFGREAVAASGFERGGPTLDAAVDGVSAGDEGVDAARAFAFAAAVLRGRPGPVLVMVSDGHLAGPPVPGGEVRFVPVGAVGPNVALMGFSARRRPLDGGAVDATVVVHNFADQPASGTLELTAGGRVLERVPVTLAAGERSTRTVGPLATIRAELEARYLPGGPDLLAFDDRAYAVVPERTRRKVLVVGADNLYLDGALLSFGDTVAIDRVSVSAAEGLRARWPEWATVIFDGVAPGPPPERGRYLYFDPQGPGSPWTERGRLADPVATELERRHPLLVQVSLADLNVREARRLELGSGDQAVAAALGVPLLVARQRPGLKMVALSFDVRRSDLPLRPTFPLLLANALEWLDPGSAATVAGQKTGTVARAAVAGEVEAVTVRGPDGVNGRVPVVGGVAEVPLPRSGFYGVAPANPGLWAANLFEAAESDSRMTPSCTVGGQAVAPWHVPAPSRRPPWPTLALILATALSLAEWATHHRRWTV